MSSSAPAPQPFPEIYVDALSPERLVPFRERGDGDDPAPAIGRYLHDLALAQAVYPALRWAEVMLRNRLHRVIADAHPERGGRRFPTWLDAAEPLLLPGEQLRVARVLAELHAEERAMPPALRRRRRKPGRLVSRLGFGFWTRLLDGRYASWRAMRRPFWPRLLPEAFPHCPAPLRTRQAVHARFVALKQMRNRVAHHERIGHLVDDGFHDRCLEAIGWMAPRLAEDLRARHGPRFAALRAEGPRPFVAWARREAG